MRRGLLMSMGILAVILTVLAGLAPAQMRGRGQGFRVCPYTTYACPLPPKDLCKPLNITGRVTGVLTESLEPGMYPGMTLSLDSKERGRVKVHLGPVWYLERQGVSFQPGDEVRVKGVCFDSGGETKLVAAEVIKGDHVLLLRDASGQPLWEAWRKR
jgi:hypothetical protein